MAARRIVAGTIARFRGNLDVISKLPGQRKVPYLPLERLNELRDERIRETVRFAAETVPYYRELFRREGIDPREIASAAELEQLPLISKATVMSDPDRFVSESRLGRDSIVFSTSGSTGIPMRFLSDRRSLLQNMAYGERQRAVEARLCGKRVLYLKVSLARDQDTGSRVRDIYQASTFIPVRPRRRRVLYTQPLERIVQELDELRADVIRGHGSVVELLFRYLAETGARMHLPRVVSYGSDMLGPGTRELIERDFGLPLLSNYTAIEAHQIAYLCEERRDFHLQTDLCHLFLVAADGTRTPPGERGEVVITNLVNRGTVLLNYRLGDVASLATGSCPCGRTQPLLSQLEGRVDDILRLEDGSVVHSVSVWDVISKHPGILRYQLVQRAARRFELRLMTLDRAQYDRIVEDLVGDLRDLLGGAEVAPRHHEALEPDAGGKLRAVIALQRPGGS